MALMYCYGSGFHVSKTRNKCIQDTRPNGVPLSCAKNHNEIETIVSMNNNYVAYVYKFLESS